MRRLFSIYMFLAATFPALTGCDSSDSKFYEDESNSGLSIFSDKANNVASAYFNDKVWRTRDRIYNVLSSTSYEVFVQKLVTTTASDTLVIRWAGNIQGQSNYLPISVSFYMAVPKTFSAADLVTLKGQRIFADGTNSYFTVDGASSLPNGKGTGTIYFHMSFIQGISPGGLTGRLAGLFEITIADLKITKGRFDHSLGSLHVNL